MKNATLDTFAEKFAAQVMVASVEIAKSRGIDTKTIDVDSMIIILREEAKRELHAFLEGANVFIECNMHMGWVSAAARVAAINAATRAVDRVEFAYTTQG